MAVRKLLLPLQSTATAEPALIAALMAARLWRAHLAVLHVAVDRSRDSAVRALFDRFAAAQDIILAAPGAQAAQPSISFTSVAGREADMVAWQARLADLTVVPHPASSEDVSSSDALHAVLFDSGQPVLIAPRSPPRTIGTRVCIGWNGSANPPRPCWPQCPGCSRPRRCAFSGPRNTSAAARWRRSSTNTCSPTT